jgi:hypothetical protein
MFTKCKVVGDPVLLVHKLDDVAEEAEHLVLGALRATIEVLRERTISRDVIG